jgi:hypothetical protein
MATTIVVSGINPADASGPAPSLWPHAKGRALPIMNTAGVITDGRGLRMKAAIGVITDGRSLLIATLIDPISDGPIITGVQS